jgi:hypothetical protein
LGQRFDVLPTALDNRAHVDAGQLKLLEHFAYIGHRRCRFVHGCVPFFSGRIGAEALPNYFVSLTILRRRAATRGLRQRSATAARRRFSFADG